MKTFSANPQTVKRDWFVIDANNKVLGRLASEIAHRLRGKHKAEYTPHVDTGDYVIVVNAEKIAVTGNKVNAKKYYRHTGYPGGIKETSFREMIGNHPARVIESAVKGHVAAQQAWQGHVFKTQGICRRAASTSGPATQGSGNLTERKYRIKSKVIVFDMAQTQETWRGTGRRKSSTARVYLERGAGSIVVNKVPLEEYFGRDDLANDCSPQPLELVEMLDKVDVRVNVSGGGNSGQAGAIRHGITRALITYDEELRSSLRQAGFVTRDAREVEPQKSGLAQGQKASTVLQTLDPGPVGPTPPYCLLSTTQSRYETI